MKLSTLPQMLHQLADLFVRRVCGERDRRLLAGLSRRVFRVFRAQPLPPGDKTGERLRQLAEQRLADCHRQIGARHHRFADRCQMAEPIDDAVNGERGDLGIPIFQQREASLRRSYFGDSGGNRARQHRAAGDGDLCRWLCHGHQVDQIGFLQQRRQREYRHRDFRLIIGERVHHYQGSILRGGEHVRERAPHQRRGIVQQHDHRAFGGGDIIGRQIGIEIGACQRRCGLGPFAGRSVLDPLQKLTDNHWHNLTRPIAIVRRQG